MWEVMDFLYHGDGDVSCIMDCGCILVRFKLKHFNDGFVYLKHTASYVTMCWLDLVMLCIIVMF